RKITLQIEPEVRQFLADKGYDPLYGARPLKRIIQREIQDPMAEDILFGKIPDETTVKITKQGDRLVFSPITQK
ncbi:MAG: ATPase, partial [Bartonella sp.]|nr:ATPase [Bartonella sp.]